MARKRTTLVSDAVEYIRNKILSYELRPGSQISDNKIALEMENALGLKISRSPVKEAFLILQAEGLVEMIKDKFCVARITDRDVFEICQVRDAIEQQSVIIAMNNGGFTPNQKMEIKKIYNDLVEAAGSKNEEREYLIDDRFHLFLVACTENNRLIEISNSMCNQMKRVRWLNAMFPNRRKDANKEHEDILSGIMNDDRDFTLNAIHTHSLNTQKNFQRIFESEELKKALVYILNETG